MISTCIRMVPAGSLAHWLARLVITAFCLLALLAAAPARSVTYAMTDIGIIGSSGDLAGGDVVGVNKSGQLAGWSQFFSASPGSNILGNSFLWTPSTPNGRTGSAQEIPPPVAFQFCIAAGLNNAGHVACEGSQPRIWNGGTAFTTLPLLEAGFNDNVSGINNLDGVIGTGFGSTCPQCAIWWPSGAAAPVVLETRQSSGRALNSAGSFVGNAYGDDNVYHATSWAFLVLAIIPRTLNNDASHFSDALAVNDAGTTVGIVSVSACANGICTFKPVVWASDGTQSDLPPLNGGGGSPFGINSAGDIVGYSNRLVFTAQQTFTKQKSAILWKGGTALDLNTVTDLPPQWRLVTAKAINDSGQIGAIAEDQNHSHHAVLLTIKPNTAPVAKCKAVTVAAGGSCQAPASIDDGSSDPDGDSITLSQSPAGPYSLGTTLVTLSVTDSNAAASFCRAEVTVVDQTAPTASCPLPTAASANASCKAAIPNVLPGVIVADNCTAAGSLLKAQSPLVGTLVGLGSTPIGVTVTDAATNASSCTTAFTVSDTTGPSVTSTVSSPSIWSPQHGLISVGLAVRASDNCDGSPAIAVAVYSNEPDQAPGDDDASFSPDARDIAPVTLRLRGERVQSGNGRVYLIVSTATDASGNSGFSCSVVVVAHDQNAKSLAVANDLGAAAQSYCATHNGAPPAGYVQVGTGPTVGPKQ